MLAGIAGETALEALRRTLRRGEAGTSLVLTPANARRLTETLADLRGAAMKLGQMLSLQAGELLPPELAEVLGTLRDQAYFMPADQLEGVLQEELGPDWRGQFREFDAEPLAAASIGQVHAAVTIDGREIALKVQYPGVARSIASDVDNLILLLRVLQLLPAKLELGTLRSELKRELRREADYGLEAASTERYRDLVKDDPTVFVPRLHRDLSTRRVLATDRVHGLPLEDLRSPEHPQARRDALGEQLLRLVLRELFVFRFMQTDPNFANYLYEPEGQRVALLDFGATRSLGARFTSRYRKLIVAAVEEDGQGVIEAAEALGFLRGDESSGAQEGFITLCELFAEPLRTPGPYDFVHSDLARRFRDHAMNVMLHHELPQPPTETLFLHRKLGGSFLLCAHIGATIDCRRLYHELVVASPDS